VTRRVAVLLGGRSAEREVSLVSGRAVADALRGLGHEVTEIDVAEGFLARLPALKGTIDVVFNALHGRWGEDGCVQGALELAEIPYTHSGVVASAVAMDKPMARVLFAASGIPVPEGDVFGRDAVLAGDPMPRPYVVKPLNEGSSVGVHIVLPGSNGLSPDEPWPFGDRVLVERYVPGREVTVAVMGDRALGALEIQPVGSFYDYDAKYTAGRSRHVVPAPIAERDYGEALRLARLAHDVLGCRGVSRADFRLDDSEGGLGLRLLEVNTQPGMTPLSLVPEIAAYAGIDFPALVDWMVEDALCRS